RARRRESRGRWVDVGTGIRKPAQLHALRASTQSEISRAWTFGGRRPQDATRRRPRKAALSREETKPSDGLEPSTPSYQPPAIPGNPWQRFAYFCGFGGS